MTAVAVINHDIYYFLPRTTTCQFAKLAMIVLYVFFLSVVTFQSNAKSKLTDMSSDWLCRFFYFFSRTTVCEVI